MSFAASERKLGGASTSACRTVRFSAKLTASGSVSRLPFGYVAGIIWYDTGMSDAPGDMHAQFLAFTPIFSCNMWGGWLRIERRSRYECSLLSF
jgi:hypothetical protein